MKEKRIYQLIDVSLEGEHKSKGLKILDSINLTVDEGEFICILGPTGCGKSSLMNLLSGLYSQTDGILLYKGDSISGSLPKADIKNIGVAFQSDNLFEWLTVEKNIALSSSVFKTGTKEENAERLDALLDLVGLKDYRMCYPKELSGGMRQRCAFARALMNDPSILLLDQPFGALDAITRKILGIELLKMWHDDKKTVVMVTNSVPEALLLSQKVIVLSSAPAKVSKVVVNDISYDDRLNDLEELPRYLELKDKLDEYVHARVEKEA